MSKFKTQNSKNICEGFSEDRIRSPYVLLLLIQLKFCLNLSSFFMRSSLMRHEGNMSNLFLNPLGWWWYDRFCSRENQEFPLYQVDN